MWGLFSVSETYLIMRAGRGQNLLSKICLRCQRLFAWLKNWLRDWKIVLSCSDACRRGKFANLP